jgi:hypothetical protein
MRRHVSPHVRAKDLIWVRDDALPIPSSTSYELLCKRRLCANVARLYAHPSTYLLGLGAKRPGVTVPQGDAVAVEPLKQRNDDPPAAAEFLAKLTYGCRSPGLNILIDYFSHAL